MSSPEPSPSPSPQTLPWIVQPGTYQWIDDIFNTPIKQWGTILSCIVCCIFCLIIMMVLMSGESENSFGNFMKTAMKRKLVNLAI